MTIAHRCLDEMHVEAAGCRDRHQGIAASAAHRDRLENLAGVDAERPRLGDGGVGLLVRDRRVRDAVGFEMLRYPCHHPAPLLARQPSITRMRPRDPWPRAQVRADHRPVTSASPAFLLAEGGLPWPGGAWPGERCVAVAAGAHGAEPPPRCLPGYRG